MVEAIISLPETVEATIFALGHDGYNNIFTSTCWRPQYSHLNMVEAGWLPTLRLTLILP
jgi:hypothetical protein